MKRHVVVALCAVMALGAGTLTACQPNAVAGRRCAPEGDFGIGAGWDGGNTYQCRGGRWAWAMTTAEAARLLKAVQDAATTTTSAPPPVTPADLSGCYAGGYIGKDISVVGYEAPAPPWLYELSIHESSNGSCSADLIGVMDIVDAPNPAVANARCEEVFEEPIHAGSHFATSVPALANIYTCNDG